MEQLYHTGVVTQHATSSIDTTVHGSGVVTVPDFPILLVVFFVGFLVRTRGSTELALTFLNCRALAPVEKLLEPLPESLLIHVRRRR